MKIKTLYALLLCVSCCEFSAIGQGKRSLPERILHSVAKHERKWEPKENKTVSAAAMASFDLLYMQWHRDKSPVDALIFIYSSVDEAKLMFAKKGPALGPSLGGGMRMLDKRVPNLGVDNYTWQDVHWEGQQGVVFRKGSVFVVVTAYSMDDATKLASYIAKEINP
jgi:hypothetical protein